MNERLGISVREAANLLGCSVDTIYDLIHERAIPYMQLGKGRRGDYRLDYAALLAWWQQQLQECSGHVASGASGVAAPEASHSRSYRK